MKTMIVKSKMKEYPVVIGKNILEDVRPYIDTEIPTLFISDDGVPEVWKEMLFKQFSNAHVFVIPQGEQSKNIDVLQGILAYLVEHCFSRNDQIIALGGGVVGDLAGFVASIYLRGIHFINLPTTLLSQVDSSIGGKTAIDFMGHKNLVGSFYPADLVLIDPNVLTTLPEEQIRNGMAEVVKCGMILDPQLYELCKQNPMKHLEELVIRSLEVKKHVVEEDENEGGYRKILNFGHTYGHAIESLTGAPHGYCVAIGMMKALQDQALKEDLKHVLMHLGLPYECDLSNKDLYEEMVHDKKADHEFITMVRVDKIGHAYFDKCNLKAEVGL